MNATATVHATVLRHRHPEEYKSSDARDKMAGRLLRLPAGSHRVAIIVRGIQIGE